MKNPLFNRHRFDHHEHDTGPEPSVASANECTGLMFIPPEDQAQWESYQQLVAASLNLTRLRKGNTF